MVFDVGGGKIQYNSDLTKQFNNYKEKRPWDPSKTFFRTIFS